ncbi:MAG: NADH-quinone oxidoreductase subunit A [Asgard group archaeon]|nr:NADH-quinone oxidoreductase subunit A [Asgard group archaeon]
MIIVTREYSLWLALGLVLLAVILLYLLGRRIAPSKPTAIKCSSYACGEDMPGKHSQFYPNTFIFAIYFSIFDILAFVLATAMSVFKEGPQYVAVAAIFAGIGLLGVIVLRR